MTSLSEQLSAVRQSQWEAQLDILRTLSTRALDSAEQLIALNMKTSRASVEQAAGTLKQMLEANNPRDLAVLSSGAQGQWQNVLAYSRELLGIATGTHALGWTTLPVPTRLLPAPAPLLLTDVPASVPQVLEQVSIATASATSINSEIAAAAADSGAALAEATLQVGTDTLQRTSAQAVDAIEAAAPQPGPDAPVPEVTELEAETTGADASETPQPDTVPAPADGAGQAPKAQASAASAAYETVLEITVPPDAIVDAIVDQAISDDVPPAKASPLVEALNGIAPEPVGARHPIASTIPLENGAMSSAIELPAVEPVDAAPPPPQAAERRRAPRAPRKK
jgi:phasin family protein